MSLPLKVKDPKCGHQWRVNPDDLIDPDWLKCPVCADADEDDDADETHFSGDGRRTNVDTMTARS